MRSGFLVLLAVFVTLAAEPRVLAAPATQPVVAVLYFDYEGSNADLGVLKKGFTNILISDLWGLDSIFVIERTRLESVLGELKLQATAKIDPASAVRTGKLLGAQFLVLGGYFEIQDKLRVDARVIEVETGRIVLSTGATGKLDEFLTLEQQLAGELKAHFRKVVPRTRRQLGTPPRVQPAVPPAKLTARTVATYGRALTAMDAGDQKAAEASLKQVIAEAPDFALAAADLARLMK